MALDRKARPGREAATPLTPTAQRVSRKAFTNMPNRVSCVVFIGITSNADKIHSLVTERARRVQSARTAGTRNDDATQSPPWVASTAKMKERLNGNIRTRPNMVAGQLKPRADSGHRRAQARQGARLRVRQLARHLHLTVQRPTLRGRPFLFSAFSPPPRPKTEDSEGAWPLPYQLHHDDREASPHTRLQELVAKCQS